MNLNKFVIFIENKYERSNEKKYKDTATANDSTYSEVQSHLNSKTTKNTKMNELGLQAITFGFSSLRIKVAYKFSDSSSKQEITTKDDNLIENSLLELNWNVADIYLLAIKDKVIDIIYPTNASINFESSDTTETIAYINLSPIEVEISLELLFMIKFLLENLAKTSAFHLNQIFSNQADWHYENESVASSGICQEVKRNILPHKYSLELDIVDMMVILLKENQTKSSRSTIRYLPLWSWSFKDSNLVFDIDTANYELVDHSSLKTDMKDVESNHNEILAKEIAIESTIELNYFNFGLNFYEPFIEEFSMYLIYKSDSQNKSVVLETSEKKLDLNIPTALAENITVSTVYLKNILAKTNSKEVKQSYKKSESISNQLLYNKIDVRYTLENCLGEDIMIATWNVDNSFEYVEASHTVLLEFNTKELEKIEKDNSDIPPNHKQSSFRSPYRRENFRIGHETEKDSKQIWLKIPSIKLKENLSSLDESGSQDILHTKINIEQLEKHKSLKVELDKSNNLFLYCYLKISSSVHKQIILRSPLQVNNDLKIPLEVKLYYDSESKEEVKFERKHKILSVSEVKYHLDANSAKIIPVYMSNVKQVQVKPLNKETYEKENNIEELKIVSEVQNCHYEWCDQVQIDVLGLSEKQLFETPSQTIKCLFVRDQNQENVSHQYQKDVYFMMSLNSFWFSKNSNEEISSFITSNSFKYISFNAPYTIINSLPFSMRMFFDISDDKKTKPVLHQNPNLAELVKSHEDSKYNKQDEKFLIIPSEPRLEELNIIEENKSFEEVSNESLSDFDDKFKNVPKIFDYIDMNRWKEVSLLDTNPEHTFLVSIQPKMYRASNFLDIKNEDDFKYLDNKNENDKDEDEDENDEENKIFEKYENDLKSLSTAFQHEYKKKCSYRFLKKKTFVFQITSLFYDQLSICWDVTSINGLYKLHFYTKYWFLNNTELPIWVKLEENDFEYDEISLPYVYKNFDFEDEANINKKQVKSKSNKQHSYDLLISKINNNEDLMQMMRIKPWERFKFLNSYENKKGLLGVMDKQIYDFDDEREFGIYKDEYDSHDSFEDAKNEEDDNLSVNEVEFIKEDALSRQKLTITNQEFEFPDVEINDRKRIRVFSTFDEENKDLFNSKLMIRIENKEFEANAFDISNLQTFPQLSLKSNSKDENMSSEYSVVPSFKLLPHPFSKTVLVTLKSKYKILNKCYFPIYIIQDDCEQNFCLFPHEKSIFHWTDRHKKKRLRIRVEDHDVSGPFTINKVWEYNIRWKAFGNDSVSYGNWFSLVKLDLFSST